MTLSNNSNLNGKKIKQANRVYELNSVRSTEDIESARQLAARCCDASPRLAMIAAGITGNRSDADDIVQQAITIAIEKNMSFSSESHFMGWLAGVVRNCALNYQRKFSRRKTQPTDPSTMTSVATQTESTSPVDSAGQLKPLQNSFDDRVQAALQEIAPNARSCLLLRTVEGLSYKEISKLMSIPEGTAMNLVHRSKAKLRKILAGHESTRASGSSTEMHDE